MFEAAVRNFSVMAALDIARRRCVGAAENQRDAVFGVGNAIAFGDRESNCAHSAAAPAQCEGLL